MILNYSEYGMNIEDTNNEIREVHKSLKVFSNARKFIIVENKEIVIALNTCGANVGFVEINSDKGHDSFLLDVPEFLKTVSEFLHSSYNEINNEKRI